jgi:hypothetical protein
MLNGGNSDNASPAPLRIEEKKCWDAYLAAFALED